MLCISGSAAVMVKEQDREHCSYHTWGIRHKGGIPVIFLRDLSWWLKDFPLDLPSERSIAPPNIIPVGTKPLTWGHSRDTQSPVWQYVFCQIPSGLSCSDLTHTWCKWSGLRFYQGKTFLRLKGDWWGNGEESIFTPTHTKEGSICSLKDELLAETRWVHSKSQSRLGND